MNCRGCRQRFLPLPDLSRKIEGDSVRRVLSKHSLSQNKYYFNLYEFLKRRIHAFVGKLNKTQQQMFLLVSIFAPLKGTQTWRLHTQL